MDFDFDQNGQFAVCTSCHNRHFDVRVGKDYSLRVQCVSCGEPTPISDLLGYFAKRSVTWKNKRQSMKSRKQIFSGGESV